MEGGGPLQPHFSSPLSPLEILHNAITTRAAFGGVPPNRPGPGWLFDGHSSVMADGIGWCHCNIGSIADSSLPGLTWPITSPLWEVGLGLPLLQLFPQPPPPCWIGTESNAPSAPTVARGCLWSSSWPLGLDSARMPADDDGGAVSNFSATWGVLPSPLPPQRRPFHHLDVL